MVSRVVIDLDDDETRRLWEAVGDIAGRLPGTWVLVGGLMVQLHVFEHGNNAVRATADIDVLGQARPQGALLAISNELRAAGFEPQAPDADGYVYRFRRGDLVVDLLAPDGLRPPPELAPGQRAVAIPGGSQALRRSEDLLVAVRGREFRLRRPTLLGAILIKARSIVKHADPGAQREDLLQLLSLVDDPRVMARDIKKTERRWLRAAEERLALDAPALIDPGAMRNARLVYRAVVRDV